tara:strand:- start:264 stop:1766 length:1503 start_codon:yes stop_codon:yes gene_type:complete
MRKDNQPYLPLNHTPVKGSQDFNDFQKFYRRLNTVLLESGLDLQFGLLYVEAIKKEKDLKAEKLGKTYMMPEQDHLAYRQQGIEALRCNIIREQESLSYRKLNIALASNTVLQNFCHLGNLSCIRVPSKSKLQSYASRLACDDLAKIHERFNTVLFKDKVFVEDISAGDLYMDSTCVKAQMRYPVDWLLIRDGCRTVLKAMKLIRKSGVKCRMPQIDGFMTKVNGLCIEMAAANRTNDAVKKRKATLRKMKKLEKVIRKHAQNHYEAFEQAWPQSTYTQGRAELILNRIKKTIDIMPAVIHQAHERIIGERQVKNADKILSLYQNDIHIVKRRKSEAHNEFGSQLLIAEQADGFIVDFHFEKDKVSNDSKMVPSIIERFETLFNQAPLSITTDRGFSSPKNTELLASKKIYNAICPRSVPELKEKMTDDVFRNKLKRRGPNEGRVGIVKNNFLRGAQKAYGYDNRHKAVSWGVLVHNLSKLTKLLLAKEHECKKKTHNYA